MHFHRSLLKVSWSAAGGSYCLAKGLQQIYALTFFGGGGGFHWWFQDLPRLSDMFVVANSSSEAFSLVSPPPVLRDAIVG